jgi:hypothetical protein
MTVPLPMNWQLDVKMDENLSLENMVTYGKPYLDENFNFYSNLA